MIFFVAALAVTYVAMDFWLKYYLDGPSSEAAALTRPQLTEVDEEEWAPVDGSHTWEERDSDEDLPLEANRD